MRNTPCGPVLIKEYGSALSHTLVTERDDRPVNPTIQAALVRERLYLRSPRTVAAARQFTRDTLHAWAAPERLDDVLLCVSELATNALRYGVPPSRGYLLRMYGFEDATVRVEVHDSGPGFSRITERPHGHGLTLVAALSDDWGVLARTPGKVVWCEFRCAATWAAAQAAARQTGV
ncbi:histidine kinase-like protein [Streptomyces sp. CG 926]|uniref:ATP-binding protein n=1 Tax=Streptomyces sp. CG 926 TaxID=1882405 RepID=UPI000D6B86EF|nr:ATP-binding protein [Streptomyces sp. CG 926]PWK73018.1 histidine kinase-like protein [Streptomyces sp. CG 926]